MSKNVNHTHKEKLTVPERIATGINNAVGTFSCFIFFAVLACVSLPSVIESGSTIIWVSWVTQSFIQLVLLPLIMISQNLSQRHSELKAEEDFEINVKSEKEIEDLHRKIDKLLAKNVRITKRK